MVKQIQISINDDLYDRVIEAKKDRTWVQFLEDIAAPNKRTQQDPVDLGQHPPTHK
jgi:hypothetical protein